MGEDQQKQLVQAIAAGVAQAFQIQDQKQLEQILQSLSQECIQALATIVTDQNSDDNQKIQAIKQTVQKDLQASQAQKAAHGAKLAYINTLNGVLKKK